MNIIDEIVEEYHKKLGPCRATLQICGNSPFTRALMRRCCDWGVPFAVVNDTDWCYPVVVDYEVEPGAHAGHDIDDSYDYALPACAVGILRLCERLGVSGKVVTIIGRGRAVKGLAEALLADDATVCVCHSKTPEEWIGWLYGRSDIVVDASDGVVVCTDQLAFGNDLIGHLTTAILAYRASLFEG